MAMIPSSGGRGSQPSSSFALSDEQLRRTPISVTVWRTPWSKSATTRTSQFGTRRVGTRAARSPRPSLSTSAIRVIDMKSPEMAEHVGLARLGEYASHLHALLAPAVQRYEALGEEERTGFRGLLTDYVQRLYLAG